MTTTMTVSADTALSNLSRRPNSKKPPAKSLAKRINEAHLAVEQTVQDAIDLAMKCGDLLIEAKTECAHGSWTEWLKNNFEGSDRSARVYMRLADHRDLIEAKRQTTADLTIEKALNYIAPKRERPAQPDLEQLRVHERMIEDGLAATVIEHDQLAQRAASTGTPHEQLYQDHYA